MVGRWWTGHKDAQVDIYRDGNQYFGKLVWIKDDPGPDAKSLLDTKNPIAALRARPLLGLVFVQHLHFDAKVSQWEGGEVYDSDNGKTYKLKISRVDGRSDAIKIRGYLGIPLLGGSEVWTRVP